MPIMYKSTNNAMERVNFETGLLRGLAPDYGLYMVARQDIPRLQPDVVRGMREMSYSEVAFQVLRPYLLPEVPEGDLAPLLDDAYRVDTIPTEVQRVTEDTYIMWLTRGPTYSFKDYAARFLARMLLFPGEAGPSKGGGRRYERRHRGSGCRCPVRLEQCRQRGLLSKRLGE